MMSCVFFDVKMYGNLQCRDAEKLHGVNARG
jgi:hypothetical protein